MTARDRGTKRVSFKLDHHHLRDRKMKTETKEEIKDRRRAERLQRKENKKMNKKESVIIASQNFQGSFNELRIEETRMQMHAQHIGLTFGQECRHQIASKERWDSGELLVTFGTANDKGKKDNMVKCGNVFFLSKYWASAFLRGGKQKHKYCDRLVTIRIPLRNRKMLYLVNSHYPDSSKSRATRSAYQRRLEQALNDVKANDILVLMGDLNASTGKQDSEDDNVCGPYGLPHQNEAGRTLKATAAMHELSDLVTWHEQQMPATYYDINSGEGRQLDRAFVHRKHTSMIKRCFNASMLVNSDHESLRLNMEIDRVTPPPKTTRQTRNAKDIAQHFMPQGETATCAIRDILHDYEHKQRQAKTATQDNHKEYNSLLQSVVKVIETIPPKKKSPRGWCELNAEDLTTTISARNTAAREHAKTKTEASRLKYKDTRSCVRKAMRSAKNAWLLNMLNACNLSLLPGGKKANDAKAIWTLITKLKRGVSKWKQWNYKNIQDNEGQMANSPSTNADNFQAYYTNLFSNKPNTENNVDKADKWYAKMTRVENDREWRPPTETEMMTAVKSLKKVSPGLSGIPAEVWKAIARNTKLRAVMLCVMRRCWNEEEVPTD